MASIAQPVLILTDILVEHPSLGALPLLYQALGPAERIFHDHIFQLFI